SRFHNKHGYRLKLEYRRSTKISNNKISAEVKQFVFNQDFIYPIGKFLLFSKDVFVFLGPSMEIFMYNLEYDFVHHGSNLNADASGYMVSLGINSEFIYKVNTKLNIESFVRSNLLSVVSKEFDRNRYDESSPQLMTVVSATNIDFDLSIRYYVFKKLSVKAGYRLELTRINKWEPFISYSDNLIFSLTYKF
ncbi:MAG: hypothetical protein HQ541_00555, partial [Mariniphaga sp.]|nr:hypothetical protein [Mariniphaga sp.]